MFAFRLASNLRRPLAELLGYSRPGDPLSAAEFALWRVFYLRYGFDPDRIEWTVAKSGRAVARAMGSHATVEDLIAKFGVGGSTHGQIMAFFDSLVKPGANGEQ